MKKISLTKGKFALIDAQDYWLVKQFNWQAYNCRRNWYAVTHFSGSPRKFVRMHRLLAGFPPFDIDHKNRNGLDNRRNNLRPASNGENIINSRVRKDNKSGFKGVHRSGHKWRARIAVNKQLCHLGLFEKVTDAAAAYKRAAKFYFGEFAK